MAEVDGQRLTLLGAAGALAIAAVAAGAGTIILFAASAYLLPSVGPGGDAHVAFTAGQLVTWLELGLLSILFWALGFLVIGAPAWLIMHRSGLTRRFHALIVGALIAGVAGYVVGTVLYAPFPVAWFIAFSLIGMFAAWIVWAMAYRRKSRTIGPSE